MTEPTWGHWCYEQEPVRLPVSQPRCPQCGAMNVNNERKVSEPGGSVTE